LNNTLYDESGVTKVIFYKLFYNEIELVKPAWKNVVDKGLKFIVKRNKFNQEIPKYIFTKSAFKQ